MALFRLLGADNKAGSSESNATAAMQDSWLHGTHGAQGTLTYCFMEQNELGIYLNGSRGGSRLSSITSSCCSPAPLPPALPPPGFGGPALAVSGPSAEDVKDGGEADQSKRRE
eukprot:1147347-Pelagomonas_calceolata.AAC.1